MLKLFTPRVFGSRDDVIVRPGHDAIKAPSLTDPTPAGTHVRSIIEAQLQNVGIKTRHAREFLKAWETGKWTLALHKEFWGPQFAQMANTVNVGPFSGVIPASAVNMPDWSQFAAEVSGFNEVLRWGLYDRVTYATTGQATLTFFQNSPNAGFQITNMLQPGALPGNQSQLVMGLRVGIEPAAADILSGVAFQQWIPVVLGKNWVEFTIATKVYIRESPIAKMAPGYGVVGSPGLAAAASAAFPQVGTPDRNAIWNLNIPLGILPTRTFAVTCNWNPVVTVTTAGTMVAELDGLMLRAAQ